MTPTLLDLHRERDAREVGLAMMRSLRFDELNEVLQDLTRQRIAECQGMIDRANRVTDRDLRRESRSDGSSAGKNNVVKK